MRRVLRQAIAISFVRWQQMGRRVSLSDAAVHRRASKQNGNLSRTRKAPIASEISHKGSFTDVDNQGAAYCLARHHCSDQAGKCRQHCQRQVCLRRSNRIPRRCGRRHSRTAQPVRLLFREPICSFLVLSILFHAKCCALVASGEMFWH